MSAGLTPSHWLDKGVGLGAGFGAGDDLNSIPSRRLPLIPSSKFHHVKEHDSRICVTKLGSACEGFVLAWPRAGGRRV